MSEQYKEGDLATVTLTGKVERVRGKGIVIVAHGVEIPVLASQIEAPWSAIGPLWEIAKAVDDADTTYSTGPGDLECVFCNGDTIYDPERSLVHESDCVVLKARELLARERPK